jgi:hypothetical protein
VKVSAQRAPTDIEGRAVLVPVLGLTAQLPPHGRGQPPRNRACLVLKQRRGVGGVPGVRAAAPPIRAIEVKHDAHARGGGEGHQLVPGFARHADFNPRDAGAAAVAARATRAGEEHRVRGAAANAQLRGRRGGQVGGQRAEGARGEVKVVVE